MTGSASFPNAILEDGDQQRRELAEVGSCLCKSVLSAQACADLREKAEALLLHTSWASDRAAGSLAKGAIHFGHLSETGPGKSFLFDLFNHFRNSPALDVLEEPFGRSVAFALKLCTVRLHRGAGVADGFARSQLPLHQDNFPRDQRVMMINTWIPLQDCGTTAPGLELFRTPVEEYFFGAGLSQQDIANSNIPKHEVGYQAMAERFGEACVARPEFGAGDAAIFNRFTLHRTNVTSEMTAPRISIELRACSGKLLLSNYNLLRECRDWIILSKTKKGVVMQRHGILAIDTAEGAEQSGTIALP